MTLTERRRSKDMALGELARKVGISTVAMSRIETGKIFPDEALLPVIASHLDCEPRDILAGLPTAEEAAANFERLSDCMAAMNAAMQDAKEKGFKRGNGGRGELLCPICKATLRYSVASVNGHLWGKCSTPGCVSWMQ